MATLTEVARKYKISDAFLNSKDDGLVISGTSIYELINEIKMSNLDSSQIIRRLERLANFMKDVKNSTL